MTDSFPQMASMEEELDILRDEISVPIWKLRDGKAPRYDDITAEELKTKGETDIDSDIDSDSDSHSDSDIDILHHLCKLKWRKEEFLEDLGKAITTPIYKKKTSWIVETTEGSAY